MTTADDTKQGPYDPEKLTEAVAGIAAQSQALMQDFLAQQGSSQMDPMGLGQAFFELTTALMKNPEKLLEAQFAAWNSYMDLWVGTAHKMLGREAQAVAAPEQGDRRFKHEAWAENPFFDFIKQSYLLAANTIQNVVAEAEGLDDKTAHKVQFYTRQYVDALSPSNFALTNPAVLEATLESKGQNLLQGLQNFCDDFDAQTGRLRIKMTDTKAFELGENVAVSPGKVVYQNELMQLIQYAPLTEEVNKPPLLIIPPWINKFYILDLQPKNSMIKWLVEQGHTVFVISWVNPDESLAAKDFADYVFAGVMAALDAIERATGETQMNVIGYCIGGTLLATTLAYMQAKQDQRILSATFFVSLIDFSEPGDLGVFTDEQQIERLEKSMNESGYLDGAEMAATFNMMRANDLIWSFFVNNYLLGKEPFPFDLLYWNADSTRLPAKMHSTYLRTMYLHNRFKEPGGLKVGDVDIDVGTIKTPCYFISTEDDHIAPWASTYLGAQLMRGPVRFVLGKSGHIAGIVNHPAANKYGYYTGPARLKMAAEQWLDKAKAHDGSWWPDWQRWVGKFSDAKVAAAREPGAGGLQAIEDAPGSYVKVR